MKVIELLTKIANGEDVPKYINYTHKAFGKDTMMVCKENIINKLDIGAIELNDEVEIIEEDKKIETIKWKSCADNLKDVNDNIDDLVSKINEIIDYINKEVK